jgi:hypothetical protein
MLEHRTMEKVQRPSDFECYTPSLDSFKIILHHLLNVSVQFANNRGLKKILNYAIVAYVFVGYLCAKMIYSEVRK